MCGFPSCYSSYLQSFIDYNTVFFKLPAFFHKNLMHCCSLLLFPGRPADSNVIQPPQRNRFRITRKKMPLLPGIFFRVAIHIWRIGTATFPCNLFLQSLQIQLHSIKLLMFFNFSQLFKLRLADYCFICSSCLIIIFFTISPPMDWQMYVSTTASRYVFSPIHTLRYRDTPWSEIFLLPRSRTRMRQKPPLCAPYPLPEKRNWR